MRIVILLGSLATILLLSLAGTVLWNLRLRDIDEAKRELRTLNLLLIEETERAMESVDLILKSVQEHIAADGVASPADMEATQAGRDTHELLKSKFAGVPQIDALTLVAADGHIINLSRVFPVPAVNLADRDYFKALRDNPADVALLTRPVVSRVSGREAMFLARRINSPSGAFLGVVLGTIDLGYFDDHYKAMRGSDGVVVTLWHKGGIALTRYPPLDPGRKLEVPSLAEAPQSSDPLAYTVDRSEDGPARIVAIMAARQFPLVVTISKTFNQVLADWQRKAVMTIAACAFGTGSIAIGVWLLGRQFATYEALRVAIAERGQAVAARDEAEAQLRQAQKLEAIGQLTGGIAHDFNNLLTAILGNLELLRRHTEAKDPRLQRWSTNAIEAAKRGAALTARLLAFSRRQPLDPQPADIAHLLDSMSDLLARTLGESIEVVTTIEPHLWRPFVDLSGLDNAILNIALNARDAMDGRGRLSIEASNHVFDANFVRAHPDAASEHYVRIAISDTGRGIEKDVVDRVFEPFFTTKPVGQGTGLGLSQVYGFIKQSGGHIVLASEVGRGTIVEMFLPRATDEQFEGMPAASLVEEEEEPTANTRGTILVVENDENVRAYAVETLRELGYRVFEAADAMSGLAVLRADNDIVLLFTDVGLPGMNGRELADEALRLRPDLDVLFTTGYARNAFADRGTLDLAQNVNLITKPFTRAELIQKLRVILTNHVKTEGDQAPIMTGNVGL